MWFDTPKEYDQHFFKNTMIISIGLLTFALVGFYLMYPGFVDGEGFL